MINRLDQLHRDRKLIQTLYMDGVRWDDLLLHFFNRYTRSEIMGFVSGQSRHYPMDCERSVDDLLRIYLLPHDGMPEPDASEQGRTSIRLSRAFQERIDQSAGSA